MFGGVELGLKLTSLLFISIEAGIIIISAQYKIGRQVISKAQAYALRSYFFLCIGIRTKGSSGRQGIALVNCSFFSKNGLGGDEVLVIVVVVVHVHQNFLIDHSFVPYFISSKSFWLQEVQVHCFS